MSREVILYDLPSTGRCCCWSPNVWKTRLALNFKGIPYKTEWVEYPDLEPKFKTLGIPPNPPGSFSDYSSPTVRMPDGKYIMDSRPIAEALDNLKPEPSLHLEAGLHEKIEDVFMEALYPLLPNFMPVVCGKILREGSASWFAEDRERREGMPLSELEQKKGGESAWKAAEPGMQHLKDELSKHKTDEGPFVLGSTPSYGDLEIAALFEGLEKVDQGLYERFMRFDQRFGQLHQACKPWCKRDD